MAGGAGERAAAASRAQGPPAIGDAPSSTSSADQRPAPTEEPARGDGKRQHSGRRQKGLLGRRRSQSYNDVPAAEQPEEHPRRSSAPRDEPAQTPSVSSRPGGSVRLLSKRKGSVPAVFMRGQSTAADEADGGVEELATVPVAGPSQDRARAPSTGPFPTLRRVSSKVFINPFASTSSTSLHSGQTQSPLLSPGPLQQPSASAAAPRPRSPKRLSSTISDFHAIGASDAESFEEDGREGSLQDAMDGVSDSPEEASVPGDGRAGEAGRADGHDRSRRSRKERRKAKLKEARPGRQHGAGFMPSTPRQPKEGRRHHKRHSTDATPQPRSPVASPAPLQPAQFERGPPPRSGPSQERSPAAPGAVVAPALVPPGLQGRLTGWLQHAFSASASQLPLPDIATMALETGASVLMPRERTSTSGSSTRFRRPPDLVPHESSRGREKSAPASIASPDSTSSSLRRAVGPPPTAHSARTIGNFLDKAVNYLFDTDAHAYDQRLTEDLWMMGGQRFDGKWDWEEKLSDAANERTKDWTSTAASTAGSGNDTAGSHGKRRSHRRASRAKTLFRNRRHGSDTSGSAGRSPDSPSPSPSPSPLNDLPLPRRASDVTIDTLPPTVTHFYPPPFYVAFCSILGLTYRTDFPPIPCSPDRLRGNGLTGMLSTIGMSIGRAGRRQEGQQRSPGPLAPAIAALAGPDGQGLTTDQGWGCMLRTGQSLLANALLAAHLGRSWRRPVQSIADLTAEASVDSTYARLVSWFIDSPSPLAPFSVHRFAGKGQELGKEVGEWFGPSTAAGAIKSLVNDFAPAGLGVVTDVDGTLYASDVVGASVPSPSPHTRPWQRSVLVLFNLRLGIDGVHPSYHEAVKSIFTLPQSVGIAGGRPSSSYYFFGCQGSSLFYIDPHQPRAAISLREVPPPLVHAARKSPLVQRPAFEGEWEHVKPDSSRDRDLDAFFTYAYPDSALRTFHTDRIRRMPLTGLDPSMLVGFLIRDASDWEDFCARARSMKPPLFHIADSTPSWMKPVSPTADSLSDPLEGSSDSDLGVDSLSEQDDWTEESATDNERQPSEHASEPHPASEPEEATGDTTERQSSPRSRKSHRSRHVSAATLRAQKSRDSVR